MQLCKKESLREWLAAHVQKRERAVCIDIFQQVCTDNIEQHCQRELSNLILFKVVSAVCYVHDQGLIHRDLKPSNVFFSLDGTVKVGDFGLVTHVGHGDAVVEEIPLTGEAGDHRHTQQVGTRMYMAPEQVRTKACSGTLAQ